MTKIIQALLFDQWSVTKRMGQYKKGKKANNPASSKNGFVPGGNASRADVPFQLPSELGLATLPRIEIFS